MPKSNKKKSLNIYYDTLLDTSREAIKNAAFKKDKSRLFIDKLTEDYGFMLKPDTFQPADNSIIDEFDFFIK